MVPVVLLLPVMPVVLGFCVVPGVVLEVPLGVVCVPMVEVPAEPGVVVVVPVVPPAAPVDPALPPPAWAEAIPIARNKTDDARKYFCMESPRKMPTGRQHC